MGRAIRRENPFGCRGCGAGFTLIEVLGALALLAILMAAASTPLIQMIRDAHRRSEVRMMDRMAVALEQAVIRNGTIPSTNPLSWVPMLADELSLPEDTVGINGVGTPRVLVFDPGLNLGGVGASGLPYQQSAGGATSVANARLVIVSGLQPVYPAVDLHSAGGFSNLWNRTENALPADWPSNWASEAGDLVLRRVELTGVFHEVVLNNLDGTRPAPFGILGPSLSEVGSTNEVGATNAPLTTRYIHGTPLRLVQADGRVQVVMLIAAPASFAFEAGRWSRRVEAGKGGPATLGTLGMLVETFLDHPDWGVTAQGTSPESVILGMYDMLCGCRDWADAGFENENGQSKWEAPTARFVFDVAPQLMLTSQDLIGQ